MRRSFWFIGVCVLFLACAVLVGCNPRQLVSQSQEIDIGRQAAAQVEQEYPVNTNPQLNALVNDIGQTLVSCSDRQDIKYTFKVLDVKDVNAFSLPGGWVYVDKGLITQTKGRNDELAGVMAHEIGHVVARHHAAAIGRELEANILLGTLTRGQTQQIAGIFADIQLLHYSRNQEFEADKLGIKEMYRCRDKDPKLYDPQALIDFFGGLLQIEGKPPSQFERMFQTHPVTTDRIKRAQAYLDDLKAGRAQP